MTGTLSLIVKIAILVAIAVWLADRPGTVEIVWLGYTIELSFGIFVLAAAILMAVSAIGYWLWRALVGAPRNIARARMSSRRERGYQALTQGLAAVSAGDAANARKLSKRANALLDSPPLGLLLSAQAAQLSGDDKAAHDDFEAMVARPETEFLGLRGLLNEAIREQDWLAALDIANRARRLNAAAPWLLRISLDLEVRLRRWADALKTLGEMTRANVVPTAQGQRMRAAVLMEWSREAEVDTSPDRALELANDAVTAQPGLAPAVARAANLLSRLGRDRQAAKLIEKAWRNQGHPDLAVAYQALGGGEEDPIALVRRLETLLKAAPSDAMGLLTVAEAEMAARLFGAARGHLLRIAEGDADQPPTRRVFRRLSELEVAEAENAEAARGWLERAAGAPPDPAWVCDSCGTIAPQWGTTCGGCGGFATIAWRSPSGGVHMPASAGSGLLTAAT